MELKAIYWDSMDDEGPPTLALNDEGELRIFLGRSELPPADDVGGLLEAPNDVSDIWQASVFIVEASEGERLLLEENGYWLFDWSDVSHLYADWTGQTSDESSTYTPVHLAVVSGKGGVGKTSLSVHLAAAMARRGRRVLVVDLDPQGSATTWLLGATPPTRAGGSASGLYGRIGEDGPWAIPGRPGLYILPSTPALADAEVWLAAGAERWNNLKNSLEVFHARRPTDVILDCPPALGLVITAALMASSHVLVPVTPSLLGIAGVTKVLQRVADVAREGTPAVSGIVIFGVDPEDPSLAMVRDHLRREYGDLVLKAEVGFSTNAAMLPANGHLAFGRFGDRRAARDYWRVADELFVRLGLPSREIQPRRRKRALKGAGRS